MKPEYIRVKQLSGELKLCQVKPGLRSTVTTREIVFQKPHASYAIQLNDIVSIVPFELTPPQKHETTAWLGNEAVSASFGTQYYKIDATQMKVYHRSGVHQKRNAKVIVPLSDRFLEYVNQHSTLTAIG